MKSRQWICPGTDCLNTVRPEWGVLTIGLRAACSLRCSWLTFYNIVHQWSPRFPEVQVRIELYRRMQHEKVGPCPPDIAAFEYLAS